MMYVNTIKFYTICQINISIFQRTSDAHNPMTPKINRDLSLILVYNHKQCHHCMSSRSQVISWKPNHPPAAHQDIVRKPYFNFQKHMPRPQSDHTKNYQGPCSQLGLSKQKEFIFLSQVVVDLLRGNHISIFRHTSSVDNPIIPIGTFLSIKSCLHKLIQHCMSSSC